MAHVSGLAFANLFFGATLGAGQLATSSPKPPPFRPCSAYTVNAANSVAWQDDSGVVDAATGLPLTNVASGPTAGQ